MSMKPITQAWESAPEAALAALKLEPFYQDLSWYVQQEMHKLALTLKQTQTDQAQGMDGFVLKGPLSPDPAEQQAQIQEQIARQAGRMHTVEIAKARAALIAIIPVARNRESEARAQLRMMIDAERDLMARALGKLPEFVAGCERRIVSLHQQFHALYTNPAHLNRAAVGETFPERHIS